MSLWLAMSGVLWSVVDVPHGTAVAPVTPENGNRVCHFSNVFSPCFRWAAKTQLKKWKQNGNGEHRRMVVQRNGNGNYIFEPYCTCTWVCAYSHRKSGSTRSAEPLRGPLEGCGFNWLLLGLLHQVRKWVITGGRGLEREGERGEVRWQLTCTCIMHMCQTRLSNTTAETAHFLLHVQQWCNFRLTITTDQSHLTLTGCVSCTCPSPPSREYMVTWPSKEAVLMMEGLRGHQ